jgi:hypothetical protein
MIVKIWKLALLSLMLFFTTCQAVDPDNFEVTLTTRQMCKLKKIDIWKNLTALQQFECEHPKLTWLTSRNKLYNLSGTRYGKNAKFKFECRLKLKHESPNKPLSNRIEIAYKRRNRLVFYSAKQLYALKNTKHSAWDKLKPLQQILCKYYPLDPRTYLPCCKPTFLIKKVEDSTITLKPPTTQTLNVKIEAHTEAVAIGLAG